MTKRQKWILMMIILGTIGWLFMQNSPLFHKKPLDNRAVFILQNENN